MQGEELAWPEPFAHLPRGHEDVQIVVLAEKPGGVTREPRVRLQVLHLFQSLREEDVRLHPLF